MALEYYEPGNETFLLENISDESFEIDWLWKFKAGERKDFPVGSLILYKDSLDDGTLFISIGCMGFAVEVDGKRYEYQTKLSNGLQKDIPVKIVNDLKEPE